MKIDNCFYIDVCSLCNTDDCNPSCVRYLEMNRLLKTSNIPDRLQRPIQLIAPEEDKQAYAYLTKYAQDMAINVSKGKNIVLYSPNTGNGKTSWAIKLMTNYFNQIWNGNGMRVRGIFIHVPTYIMQKKSSMSDYSEDFAELERLLPLVDLIVLDDLGTNKMSEFDISLLTSLIDRRIINNKSIIVTTNCNKQELASALGARLADRVYNTSVTVTFRATSKR